MFSVRMCAESTSHSTICTVMSGEPMLTDHLVDTDIYTVLFESSSYYQCQKSQAHQWCSGARPLSC